MKLSAYTEPLTYWESSPIENHYTHSEESTHTDVYSQTDCAHIASVKHGEISPGVFTTGLITAAPQLLDAVEAAIAYVSVCSFSGSEEVRSLRRTLKAARKAARCKS